MTGVLHLRRGLGVAAMQRSGLADLLRLVGEPGAILAADRRTGYHRAWSFGKRRLPRRTRNGGLPVLRSSLGSRRVRVGGAILAAFLLAPPAWAGDLTVFAAASLKGALDEVAAAWGEATGGTATVAYAGSSALARQIEAGAPADVFVSANADWMDVLAREGLIAAGTRVELLGNALVLVARDGAAPLELDELPEALGEGRLAMAFVGAVPAGMYGREALTSLGLWHEVAGRVAQADSIRSALALVAIGEAPYGVVYATDAMAEPRVDVVATFPPESHEEIVYPAAATAEGDAAAAAAFLQFLQGEEAEEIFAKHGFTLR